MRNLNILDFVRLSPHFPWAEVVLVLALVLALALILVLMLPVLVLIVLVLTLVLTVLIVLSLSERGMPSSLRSVLTAARTSE